MVGSGSWTWYLFEGYAAHAWRKIGLFGDKKILFCGCSRSNQMPNIDQITDIAPYVGTLLCVII